jgi:transcriptional regulator with XRE-family HTH domain
VSFRIFKDTLNFIFYASAFYFDFMKRIKPGPKRGTKHSDVERSAFGQRLFNARKARGVTQQELAGKIGITKRMVANYEGDSEGPAVERLTAIAQALNVTVSYLLGESTQKSTEPEVPATLRKHVEKLKNLPPKEQKTIFHMIELATRNGNEVHE